MVLKPWVQILGAAGAEILGAVLRVGQAPGCPWGRSRAPCVWPWGRGAGSPVWPWERGQRPLGGPGGPSGVQAALPVSRLPEQENGPQGILAVCPPFPRLPPLPAHGSALRQLSVWQAVCLEGRLSGRPVGERSCCVLQTRAGALSWPQGGPRLGARGCRTLPYRRPLQVSLQEATLDPGLRGWAPGGASVPGARLPICLQDAKGGLSPWEDEAGRSGEPGWAQRLLLGPGLRRRPWWACGGLALRQGCPAGSSWPWVDQDSPGGVGIAGGTHEAQDKGRGTASQAPCPCGRLFPPWTVGTLGTLSPVPLGAELPCSKDLTPDKPHSETPLQTSHFLTLAPVPCLSSGLRFAPGPSGFLV